MTAWKASIMRAVGCPRLSAGLCDSSMVIITFCYMKNRPNGLLFLWLRHLSASGDFA